MKPLRRELLNGLLVLVVASLLSVAFSAFQVSFNPQLWVLILIGIAVALGGYILFEITLGVITAAEQRETEWLKRIGTPARFEAGKLGARGGQALRDAVMTMSPGTEYTVMYYVRRGLNRMEVEAREEALAEVFEQVSRGTIREYKRIVCFDHEVLEGDRELRSGVLRVGEGPGTIDKALGNHCRQILTTKGCSLFVAPALVQSTFVLYGSNKAAMTVETVAHDTRNRTIAGLLFFCDPPNAEIIEQFRQFERETERHMVAVHSVRFPEDATPAASKNEPLTKVS